MITQEDLITEESPALQNTGIFEDYEGQTDDENEGEQAEEESVPKKVIKPKRIIKNPRPKLNDQSLKSARGISALDSYFERLTYKGKGHEEQDLAAILKTYEYWCHRLFPKLPFADCIDRIETLGAKKTVITHIKRIRLDIVLEDVVRNEESDDEEPAPETNESSQPDRAETPEAPPVFEELTDEQRETIRVNREKALKIRAERMAAIRANAEKTLGESSRLQSSQPGSSNTPQSEEEDDFLDGVSLEILEKGNSDRKDDTMAEKEGKEVGIDTLLDLIGDENTENVQLNANLADST